MEVDIACVGFGPAMGGFLTTLARQLQNEDGTPAVESAVSPGLPPQVVCYERADGLGFGVSGVVTKARGIRASLPGPRPGRRSRWRPPSARRRWSTSSTRTARAAARRRSRRPTSPSRRCGSSLPYRDHALELPYTPEFLHKAGGLVLSIGQFNQWVGEQLMATGQVQLWPGTPVSEPLVEGQQVVGVRLVDQGSRRTAAPRRAMPGHGREGAADRGRRRPGRRGRARARRALRHARGAPRPRVGGGHEDGGRPARALHAARAGTVLHTIGYPEPEIFGFLYVHPDRVASVGIFVPSWFGSPVRTSYGTCSTTCTTRTSGSSSRAARCARGARSRSGVGQARRAAPRRRRLRAHRRGLRHDERAHRLGRRRGVDDRHAARRGACSSSCARRSPSRRRTSSGPTSPGAGRAGWRRRGGSRRRRATASGTASSRACSAWRSPA